MNNNNIFTNNIFNVLHNSDKDKFDYLYQNMSTFQKKTIDSLLENPDLFSNYSLNDLLFDFDQNFVEYLLNLELNLYLSDSISNGISNKKNGHTKNIHIIIGNREIDFNRPRLRNEKDFDSSFIPKRTRIIKDLTDSIILLYSKNNSVNDIKDILSGMFNLDISTSSISKITQTISDDVFAWRNRQLKKAYFCVNIDCTYISIKDDKNLSSHKIPIYLAG